MNSLSINELVKGKQYRLYSDGGCKEMESTVYKVFFGINDNGDALFYDDVMGCPVIHGSCWRFYSV
jgi:hypothetical protein